MNPEFINGPTNYVKLNGSINNVEKEIHIFFDKHLELEDQTRCTSFNSIDISYYLYKLIKTSKEQLDLFMEIRTSQIDGIISNKKDIYMNDVINLFKSEFIDKVNNEANIKYSKTNSNVKLHYFDIRDHLDIFYLTKIINQKITKYINLLKNDKENKTIYVNKIVSYLNLINQKIELLDSNSKEVSFNKNIIYDKINNKQKYYLNKILNQYLDNNLFFNINLYLNIHSRAIIKGINEVSQSIKDILTYDILMNIEALDENNNKLGEHILQLYSLYTDLYLLRRILDKNYVNKCIIYSNGSHSINIIFFLIKYCNFQILKIHKSKETNLDILMNKIITKTYYFDICDLFMLKKIYIQCIGWEYIGIDDTISIGLKKYNKKSTKSNVIVNNSEYEHS
jgi:hypothetical protein